MLLHFTPRLHKTVFNKAYYFISLLNCIVNRIMSIKDIVLVYLYYLPLHIESQGTTMDDFCSYIYSVLIVVRISV